MNSSEVAVMFEGSEEVAGCVIAFVDGKRQYVYHSGKLTDVGEREVLAMQKASPVPKDALEPGETLGLKHVAAGKKAYKPKG